MTGAGCRLKRTIFAAIILLIDQFADRFLHVTSYYKRLLQQLTLKIFTFVLTFYGNTKVTE